VPSALIDAAVASDAYAITRGGIFDWPSSTGSISVVTLITSLSRQRLDSLFFVINLGSALGESTRGGKGDFRD
jgi:hypothetical protein